jgi:hypothetical protein
LNYGLQLIRVLEHDLVDCITVLSRGWGDHYSLIGLVFKDGNTPPLALIDQEQNPTAGNSQFLNPLR